MNSNQSKGPTTRSMSRTGTPNKDNRHRYKVKKKRKEASKNGEAKIKAVTESKQIRHKRRLPKSTSKIENRKKLTKTIGKNKSLEQTHTDRNITSYKSNTSSIARTKGRQAKGHKKKGKGVIKSKLLPSTAHTKHHFRAEKIISIPGKGSNPHTICPVSEDTAWVGFDFSDTIYLYNKLGEIQKTLKMPGCVDDIAMKGDGSLLVTNSGVGKIWVVDQTYTKIRELEGLNVESLLCRGLCVDNRAIFLCLMESMFLTPNENSRRIIVKINDNGEIIKTFERVKNTETFRSPYKIAVNVNGDVLIVDHGRESLIILDSNGTEKSRYGGKLDSSNIYGVCCNEEGFIFVSVYSKGSVEVLYPDGTFCQTLVSGLGHINNIKMDKIGHLWVGRIGSGQGTVDIFNAFK